MGSSRVEDLRSARPKSDKSFRGPIGNRSCTDVLCMLLFVAFLLGWAAIATFAVLNGDPMRLVYPSNSSGQVCGTGENADKKYLLFFDLTKCLDTNVVLSGCGTPQVCVNSCPEIHSIPYGASSDIAEQRKLKKDLLPFCTSQMNENVVNNDTVTVDFLIEEQICPPWLVPSKAVVGRCFPFFETLNDTVVTNATVIVPPENNPDGDYEITAAMLQEALVEMSELLNLRSVGEKVFSDLGRTWWMVLVGFIIATATAFLWIVLMRFIAGLMVWTSLFASTVLLIFSSVYCYLKYDSLKNVETSNENWFDDGLTNLSSITGLSTTWLVFFVLSLIALLIVLIILIFLRTRIRIAVELINEASHAVGDIMSTLFFPVVPFLMQVAIIAFFAGVAMFLASNGEQEFVVNNSTCPHSERIVCSGSPPSSDTTCPDGNDPECIFFVYGVATSSIYLQIYNLFGVFWVLFFISAFEEMVLAGTFASWYFTIDKRKLTRVPLLSSLYRTLRYHLGTLAFGSLIIAIIRMIRVLIEYVEKKVKDYGQENFITKAVLCCCRCCFWCLEKFMRFINRNAYIMTAIYGKNFCASAKDAFSLLIRNALRVFVLDNIASFLLFLGKLVVVGAMALLSFYIFSGRSGIDVADVDNLNYYFVPIIIVTLATYFIADMFFDVYEMAVDTLFLCFLEDLEMNDGSADRPYFMSRGLRKVLGKSDNEMRPASAK